MEDEVLRLFQNWGHDDEMIVGALHALAAEWGDGVYQAAMRQLVGKDFDRVTARLYWQEAIAHRDRLGAVSGVRLGMRSALLDYLHQVVREMRDPRIVEAHLLEDIRRASISDGLTGLFQHAYFKSSLSKEIAKLNRVPGQFAVILMDLDHFKQYNDRCGHLAGDLALRLVAERLRENTREGDVVARYGGEEFALLLPQAGRQQAFKIAERIRAAIEQTHFPSQELLDSGNLTISGGVAVYPEDGQTTEGLIARADQELYQAKSRRNAIYPVHQDRRRSFRRRVRSIIEITSDQGKTFQPGLSLDVSRLGLTVGTSLPLEPGALVRLRLSAPFWPKKQLLMALVRHVRRDPETGVIYTGLEFDGPTEGFEHLPQGDFRTQDLLLPFAP